jgi:hypothetical protein
MIAYAFDVMRHPMSGIEEFAILRRTFTPRAFMEMVRIDQMDLASIFVYPFLAPIMPFTN